MNKQDLINKWWYRMLQVLFGVLMVAYLVGGIIFFVLGIDEYKNNVAKYQERQEIQAQNQELYKKFGESIPVIDSLKDLDVTEKGKKAAFITIKDGMGNFYVNSKNFNGYHYLRDNEVKLFFEIQSNIMKLSYNHAYAEPAKTGTAVFRWIIAGVVYLIVGFVIFWLIRRIFLYIAIKDSFLKL